MPLTTTGKSVSSRESGDVLQLTPCRTPLSRRCLASSGSAGVLAGEKQKAAWLYLLVTLPLAGAGDTGGRTKRLHRGVPPPTCLHFTYSEKKSTELVDFESTGFLYWRHSIAKHRDALKKPAKTNTAQQRPLRVVRLLSTPAAEKEDRKDDQ